MAGTFAGWPWLVGIASVSLIGALVIASRAEWSPHGHVTSDRTASPLMRVSYSAMMLVLAVSIPVGMTLSVLRNR